MSGIKDLLILFYWMNNSSQTALEASLQNVRIVPRDRQIILNDLNKEKRERIKKITKLITKGKRTP